MRFHHLLPLCLLLGCSSSEHSAPQGTIAAPPASSAPPAPTFIAPARDERCPPAFVWQQGECVLGEVYFQGGTFVMGRGECPQATALEQDPGTECPLTDSPETVEVPPFYVEAAPSSCERFACLEFPCKPPVNCTPEAPHQGVLLDQSIPENDLSEKRCQNRGKRVIREDEWEFIVTAGGTRTYPWGDDPPSCDRLWPGYDSDCKLPERIKVFGVIDGVGLEEGIRILDHPPSPEGLYDLVHYTPHLVAPRLAPYSPGYSPIPYDFLVPFDHDYLGQPDDCPTYDKWCNVGPVKVPPESCGTRCLERKHGVRGGRQQSNQAWPLSEPTTKYERTMDAYKGYRRALLTREPPIVRCARDASPP